MDMRQRSLTLEVQISRAIAHHKQLPLHRLTITAATDGTVCLRGHLASSSDVRALKQIVVGVPGVKQVFCNVGLDARA